MQLQPDTLFDNRYTLRELIGRGGFSEVWLAHDTWTELDIAIKVYAPGQGMDSDGLQIFSKELAGVFNLNHANLLKPTHVGQWLSMPYLIMEYCPNGALNKRVGKLTEQEVWKVLHDVASGLAYLHGKDIVHQDIKPDNILLDENGDYRITDFGISTKARTTLRRSIGAAAVSGGTTAYMAPERFSANPAPTKASDIWSLGAMVYELITGDVPFGEIGGGLQKNGAEIPTMQAATGTVSSKLEHVVRLMLAPNAWDRPTAETLATWAADPDSLKLRDAFAALNGNQACTGNTNGGAATGMGTAGDNDSAKDNVSNSNNAGASCGRETTIFQPGSQPTIPATPCQRNTPHEGKPRVVNNSTKERMSKGLLWFFGVFIAVIIIVAGICSHEQEQKEIQAVSANHRNVVSNFDAHLRQANIDNINYLEFALNDLNAIERYEENHRFHGQSVYYTKKEKLKQKANDLYNEAYDKYQKAPTGSEPERIAKDKADKINNNVIRKL